MLGKLRKLLGPELDDGYDRSLEIGAGTGYFSLNLLQAGVVGRRPAPTSPPAWSSTLSANAERLGLEVRAARADAESLPFADQSFDLVLGHAVLHHLPDLRRAFTEFHRVLRPGGRIVFAGEPSRVGDRIARSQTGAGASRRLAPSAARRPAPPPGRGSATRHDHELERFVDIHAFAPADLTRTPAAPDSRCARSAARSWSRTGSAGSTVAGGDGDPTTCRCCGVSTRFTATCCCSGSTHAAGAAAPGIVLQPAAERPALSPAAQPTRLDLSQWPARSSDSPSSRWGWSRCRPRRSRSTSSRSATRR